MHRLIIDTTTSSKAELIKRLNAQPFTIKCDDGGAYREDPTLSQIHLVSKITDQEVEDWMYEEKGIDYIGVTTQ